MSTQSASAEFPCPSCGGPTVPPTPGTEERGYYCEVDGIAYDQPAAHVPTYRFCRERTGEWQSGRICRVCEPRQ